MNSLGNPASLGPDLDLNEQLSRLQYMRPNFSYRLLETPVGLYTSTETTPSNCLARLAPKK